MAKKQSSSSANRPAASANPASEPEKAKRFGKYDIVRLLGQGGMGKVYLGKDRDLKRTVAIKLLSKEKAENPILVKRFKAEGQAAANLNHENIIRVFDSGDQNGQLYLALEYVDGKDAHQILTQRGPFPVKRSINIIEKVALALDHAAKAGVVHRDIKPSNIMIRNDGEVKLADMGLARSLSDDEDAGITRAGTTVGTVDYMSPEQARDSKSADIRSDLYSLGATWYQLLTGQPPFPDGDLTNKLRSHATARRPDPANLNDQVPEAVSSVIARMMAIKADDRYQTVAELLQDLASIKGSRNAVLDAVLGPSDDSSDDYESDDYGSDNGDSGDYEEFGSDAVLEAANADSEDYAEGSSTSRNSGSSRRSPTAAAEQDSAPSASQKRGSRSSKQNSSSGQSQPSNRGSTNSYNGDSDDFDPMSIVEDDDDFEEAPRSRQSGGRKQSDESSERGSGNGSRPSRVKPAAKEKPTSGKKSSRPKSDGNEDSGKQEPHSKSKSKAKSKDTEAVASASGKRSLPPRSSKSGTNDAPKVSLSLDPDVIRNIMIGGGVLALAVGVGWFITSGPGSATTDPNVGNPYAGPPTVVQPANDPAASPETPEENTDAPPEVTVVDSTVTPDEQRAIDALPPLAPRSGIAFPDWVGRTRLLKVLPANQFRVTESRDGKNSFTSLTEAISSLSGKGASIVLDGPGPHRLTETVVKNVDTVAIVGEANKPRPVIEMVSRQPGKPVLDLAHTNLILSGVDVFLRDEAPEANGQTWISIDSSALTIVDCSFTDVTPESPSTLFDITSGRVETVAFRRHPGRTLFVDSTIRGAALTAISLNSAKCDVVVGNCYVDSGNSPAFRYKTARKLVTRLVNREGDLMRQMTVAGSTIFSNKAALAAEHKAPGVLEPASLQFEQCLIASPNEGTLVSIDGWDAAPNGSPDRLTVGFPRTTLCGWQKLLTWEQQGGTVNAASPTEWRNSFASTPILANQLSDAKLETPIKDERPTAIDEYAQRWDAAIQQRVGAELLDADLSRTAWPTEGYGERFAARANWPPAPPAPIFPTVGEVQTFDVSKSRLLAPYLMSDKVPDGTEVQLTGTGRIDLTDVDLGSKRVRIVCDQQGDGIVFRARTNRRDSKPVFSVNGGMLELVDAIIEMPAQSGTDDLPPALLSVDGGTVALRRCRVIDAAPARGGATLVAGTGKSIICVTDSLLAGPGTIVRNDAESETTFGNCALAAGESVVNGQGRTYLSHCSVRSGRYLFDAGDVPSGKIWIERSVLAPGQAIVSAADAAVLRSIDWYDLENVYAPGTVTTRRGEIAGPPISSDNWQKMWPPGRIAKDRVASVGTLGAEASAIDLTARNFELASGDGATNTTSDTLPPGIRVDSVGPKQVAKATPNKKGQPTRPGVALPF